MPGITQLQSSGMEAGTGGSRMASLTYLELALAIGGASLSIRSFILMETTWWSQGPKEVRTLMKVTSTAFHQSKLKLKEMEK